MIQEISCGGTVFEWCVVLMVPVLDWRARALRKRPSRKLYRQRYLGVPLISSLQFIPGRRAGDPLASILDPDHAAVIVLCASPPAEMIICE